MDTLFVAQNDPLQVVPSGEPVPWQPISAEEAYGAESVVVVAPSASASSPAPLTQSGAFQGLVLLLAALYAFLLFRNLSDVGSLLVRVTRNTTRGAVRGEEQSGSNFSLFLNIVTAIGLLFLGVVVVKYGNFVLPQSWIEGLSQWGVLAVSLTASLLCLLVGLFQWGALSLAGGVTLTSPFVAQLLLIKCIYFALLVIISTPILLLYALTPPMQGRLWLGVLLVEVAITLLLFLKETFGLFLSKKLSILYWFLYLCTVELFPLSLLWFVAMR